MPGKDDPQMLAALAAWNRRMSEELQLPQAVDEDVTDVYLALTGAAAREVVRPAAPFSALFAGYLYGAGRADSLEEAAAIVGEALRRTADAPADTAEPSAGTADAPTDPAGA